MGRQPDPALKCLLARPERDIKRAILAYLGTVPGVVAWRTNAGAAALPADPTRGHARRFVRFGITGLPDIEGYAARLVRLWASPDMVCTKASPDTDWPFAGDDARWHYHTERRAQALYIEVKSPTGRERPAQTAFLERARAAGAIAFTACSVADVVTEFRALGLLRP